MSKSKVHTNHNQGFKIHRNGIKKPARSANKNYRGMDKKYLRNLHRVRKGNIRARHAEAIARNTKKTEDKQ